MMRIAFVTILIVFISQSVFAQTAATVCPKIAVMPTSEVVEVGETVVFNAIIQSDKAHDFKYEWLVKNGKLLIGQGTTSIKVLNESTDGVLALFTINGLPANCDAAFSATTATICRAPVILIDEYGKISQAEEAVKLSNLFDRVVEYGESAEAVIKLGEGKRLNARLRFLHSYLNSINLDKTRVTFAINRNKQQQTAFYIIPSRLEIPDCEDCLIIKAEDLEKHENLIRP